MEAALGISDCRPEDEKKRFSTMNTVVEKRIGTWCR